MTGLRRALVGLGIAGFIAGAVPLVLALSAPDDINDPELTAVFGPLVGWSFIGTGLFAWYRRPNNRFGALMTAVGFTWCVSGLAVDRNSYVFTVGFLFGAFPFAAALPHAVRVPDRPAGGSLRGRGRRARLLPDHGPPVDDPALLRQHAGRTTSNPLLAFDDQSVADALISIQAVLAIVAILAVPVVLRRRWRRAGRTVRQVLAPVYGAASC